MSMDFLEAVEEQLVAATERGVGRRRWRWPWLMRLRLPVRAPSVGIAAGVGAALAASAIAVTITIPASRPRAHVVAAGSMRARSYTTAGSVPAGFQPRSFTAISEFDWWLLGTAPCGAHTCTAIVHTTDGGRTFSRIAAPPTSGVDNLRFADPMDGYAFGPQLWATHDGGRTWSEVMLGATDLAIGSGYAYALASLGGPAQTLMRSRVTVDSWAVAPGVEGPTRRPEGGVVGGLWVQGTGVILEQGRRMLVSTDQGARFHRVRGVKRAGDCSYDAVAQAGAIWAVCSTGMSPDEVLLSTDSGNSFTTAAEVPDGPIGAFAAATSTVAVASGQGPLYRTTDGGANWGPVSAPSAAWTYLGFTDPTHGVALGAFGGGRNRNDRLYYTTDGGASYHLVTIGP